MKMIILIIIVVAVFSALGLWLGVYGNSAPGENNSMSYGISMSTDKMSYSVGEPIIITLKIFNYTKEEITFHFNTGQRYDFIIENEEGSKIWRWSEDKMFTMALGEETLKPTNPEIIFKAEYKGKLSLGYYKITGIFVAQDKPMSGNVIIIVK